MRGGILKFNTHINVIGEGKKIHRSMSPSTSLRSLPLFRNNIAVLPIMRSTNTRWIEAVAAVGCLCIYVKAFVMEFLNARGSLSRDVSWPRSSWRKGTMTGGFRWYMNCVLILLIILSTTLSIIINHSTLILIIIFIAPPLPEIPPHHI